MRETSVAKKKDTASKKKSIATEKTLRAEVEKLQAAVQRAEKKADRWKAEARAATAASKKSDQKGEAHQAPEEGVLVLTCDTVVGERARPGGAGRVADSCDRAHPGGGADGLRSHRSHRGGRGVRPRRDLDRGGAKNQARAQGLTGFSRTSKADLLAALG